MINKPNVFAIGLFLATVFSCAEADERLDLLKNIATAGAPALTMKMIDQAQPKVDVDLYEWIVWEQERYSMLSQWQQWDELLVRLESLPAEIPEQFRHQAVTYRASAYLALGQTATARKILRAQIWQSSVHTSPEYETWRHQVILSYLKEERLEDARVAMLRFDQDFESEDENWLLLRATVLIKAQRYDQAIQVLQNQQTWQSRLTSLLAQFRAGSITAKELWSKVESLIAANPASHEELATLRVLGYYAAEQMSTVDRVVALERIFQIDIESPLELFQLSSERLWEAYVEYAHLVGNRAELLVGDDQAWLDVAKNASDVTPVKARSLFALLILRSKQSSIINDAAVGYINTYDASDEVKQVLLGQLFGRSKSFTSAERIPPVIRYQLVDLALKKNDIDEATRLMSGLDSYPQGTNRQNWQLRHARVLILGGRYTEGNEIMKVLISEYQKPEAAATDRILQVIFDMQTVKLHEQAIGHFNKLLRLPVEANQRREILFWIGDSYQALKKYDQAALLYLQSAMLPGSLAMDPWAQTARFNAAESLQKAGLIDDARRIYIALLKVTREPVRRSLLKHNIQQLWLNQNKL